MRKLVWVIVAINFIGHCVMVNLNQHQDKKTNEPLSDYDEIDRRPKRGIS